MPEYKRLAGFIMDFFPEAKFSSQDVRDWAKEEVPAWSAISTKDKENIIGDWENFIAPQMETELKGRFRGATRGFINRIRRFLGRLF